MLIEVDIGHESRALEKLRLIQEVKKAYLVYAVYDIIVRVEAENLENLKQIILQKIRSIEKIQ